MTVTYTHRFMVVPAANVAVAREVVKKIADTVTPSAADGMWTVGFNAAGTGTPTHYVSSGLIDASLAPLLGNASATFSAYQSAGGVTYTLTDITNMYTACPLGTFIRSDAQGSESSILQTLGLKQTPGP